MPDPIADPWGQRTPYGPPGLVQRLAAAPPGPLRHRLPADLFGWQAIHSPDRLRLHLMACECDISWTMVGQAAPGARDAELSDTVTACESETSVQMRWLRTRMKQSAPQVLVVTG